MGFPPPNVSPSCSPRWFLPGSRLGAWLIAVTALCALAPAADYHIDGISGHDNRDGRSPATAWRSFAPANEHLFEPGDRLLLRAGSVWRGGTLAPRGSGTVGHPIVLTPYGDGLRPALHGDGHVSAVIRLFNQSHWEISGLEITNHSAAVEPPAVRGIEVRARDAGLVSHLVFSDLDIHDINGPPASFSDEHVDLKSMGAIGLVIDGDRVPTAWDGVLVENCHLHDVSYVGFANVSSWSRGHRTNDPATWFPSRNIVIRGNLVERTARDGVIVRVALAPVIEHNRFLACACEGNGVGCFTFDCDGALIQYNEAAYVRYNPGDHDAMGFDSDWNCRDTVIQFNYSHHNDLGFLLLCNNGRNGFNERTIVRYNISYADGGNIVRFSGPVTDARLYNNTFVLAPDMVNPVPGDPPRIIYHKEWNGWAAGAFFANNLIVNGSPVAVCAFGSSTGNRFADNLFSGHDPVGAPAGAGRRVGDPGFAAGTPAGNSRSAAIMAFSLRRDSPARGAGLVQPDQPATDFAGRPVVVRADRVDAGALGTGDNAPSLKDAIGATSPGVPFPP